MDYPARSKVPGDETSPPEGGLGHDRAAGRSAGNRADRYPRIRYLLAARCDLRNESPIGILAWPRVSRMRLIVKGADTPARRRRGGNSPGGTANLLLRCRTGCHPSVWNDPRRNDCCRRSVSPPGVAPSARTNRARTIITMPPLRHPGPSGDPSVGTLLRVTIWKPKTLALESHAVAKRPQVGASAGG